MGRLFVKHKKITLKTIEYQEKHRLVGPNAIVLKGVLEARMEARFGMRRQENRTPLRRAPHVLGLSCDFILVFVNVEYWIQLRWLDSDCPKF